MSFKTPPSFEDANVITIQEQFYVNAKVMSIAKTITFDMMQAKSYC